VVHCVCIVILLLILYVVIILILFKCLALESRVTVTWERVHAVKNQEMSGSFTVPGKWSLCMSIF